MSELNYKSKYMTLRAKYMNDLDMAFRLGFEQGQQQSQNDQMAQAQAEQQQAEEMAAQGGQPGEAGQPGESGQPGAVPGGAQPASPGEQKVGEQAALPPQSQNPAGSELDQHIEKLESMIGKPGVNSSELAKSIGDLRSFHKSWKQQEDLKKSAEAISGIAKALHKPSFKMNTQASHNLSSDAKRAVSMQHKIVNDVMAKMEAEELRASKEIKNILNIEGFTKGE